MSFLKDLSGLKDTDPIYGYLEIVDKKNIPWDQTFRSTNTSYLDDLLNNIFVILGIPSEDCRKSNTKYKNQHRNPTFVLNKLTRYFAEIKEFNLCDIVEVLYRHGVDTNGVRATLMFIIANIETIIERQEANNFLKMGSKKYRKISASWEPLAEFS